MKFNIPTTRTHYSTKRHHLRASYMLSETNILFKLSVCLSAYLSVRQKTAKPLIRN